MKQLYKALQNALKNRPRFNFRYLTIKCPAFIVNTLLRKPHNQLFETRHWWDNYPEVDSVKYEFNKISTFTHTQVTLNGIKDNIQMLCHEANHLPT